LAEGEGGPECLPIIGKRAFEFLVFLDLPPKALAVEDGPPVDQTLSETVVHLGDQPLPSACNHAYILRAGFRY